MMIDGFRLGVIVRVSRAMAVVPRSETGRLGRREKKPDGSVAFPAESLERSLARARASSHALAQILQCSCSSECRAHSSRHSLHASAHASSTDWMTCSFEPDLRVAIEPAAEQISAQSRFSRMHWASC
jgi:hypothetical protein